MNWINKYFSLTHCLKVVGLTLIFYYFTIAFNGIVSPEGSIYNAFLDQYLNYIQWIRLAIMHVSNIIAHLCGTNAYISGQQMMNIGTGVEVEIWLPCLGIGIMSFWTSFIMTNSGTWRRKIIWCCAGIAGICFINCWRIALLLISIDNNWQQTSSLDHHDLFNIVSYILVGLMMYSYSEEKVTTISLKPVGHPAN